MSTENPELWQERQRRLQKFLDDNADVMLPSVAEDAAEGDTGPFYVHGALLIISVGSAQNPLAEYKMTLNTPMRSSEILGLLSMALRDE